MWMYDAICGSREKRGVSVMMRKVWKEQREETRIYATPKKPLKWYKIMKTQKKTKSYTQWNDDDMARAIVCNLFIQELR